MDKLKECPFCGSKVSILDYRNITIPQQGDRKYWYIECSYKKCTASPSTAYYYRKSDAIKAWNTRHPEKKELDYKYLESIAHEFQDRIAFLKYICSHFSAPSLKEAEA
jgi:hypothetical protein